MMDDRVWSLGEAISSASTTTVVWSDAHCPADDPATQDIDDDGEVEKASGGWHKGNVGDPQLIGRRRREDAPHEIGRERRLGSRPTRSGGP
jgi:hypothetical protein